jgi:hypothetical protein
MPCICFYFIIFVYLLCSTSYARKNEKKKKSLVMCSVQLIPAGVVLGVKEVKQLEIKIRSVCKCMYMVAALFLYKIQAVRGHCLSK